MTSTTADVFIIESLTRDDEENNRQEGAVLSHMLRQHGKKPIYCYIRTRKELEEMATEFRKSNYRYLHLSCHGSAQRLELTYDRVPFRDFGSIFGTSLNKKRLFLSACAATTQLLANEVYSKSPEIHSLIGPGDTINFHDAIVMWPTFYHLMFKIKAEAMKGAQLRKHVRLMSLLFKTPISYFSNVGNGLKVIDTTEPKVNQ